MSTHRARIMAAVAGYYAQRQTAPEKWQRQVEERDAAARPARKRSQWPSEASEQRTVLAWLKSVAKLHRDDYSANGDGLYIGSGRRAGIARANGLLRKGRADIEIRARVPSHPEARGVALEMKSRNPKTRATPEQVAFLERQQANGWLTCVARGSDEAINFLKGLGFGQ
jgi:phosphoglycolate phosphatase-like HAD superfamily hydrolase